MKQHFIMTRPLENCSELKKHAPPNAVTYLPVMHYAEIEKVLHIQNAHEYDYIVTSQYAAQMIAKYKLAPDSTYYCVGSTTARILKNHGYTTAIPKAHHANGLVNLIKEQHKNQKSLIYLCGKIIKHNIHEDLMQHKIKCQKLIVYKTMPIKQNFKGIFNLKTPKSIVFYANQSYDLFIKAIQSYNMVENLQECNAVWVLPKIAESKAIEYTGGIKWKQVHIINSTHDLINFIRKENTNDKC